MLFRALSVDEKALFEANVMAVVQASDLVALTAGNTGTLNIGPPNQSVLAFPTGGTNPGIPTGTTIQFGIGTRVKLTALRTISPFTFSDASIASCTLSVGDALQSGGANTTRYCAATEVSAPSTFVPFSVGTGTTFVLLAADQLTASLTGTAAHNLNTCTGGSVALYLKVEDLNQLPIV